MVQVDLMDVRHPEVGLVNQRRRVERVTLRLVPELRMRELTQLVVYSRQESVQGRAVRPVRIPILGRFLHIGSFEGALDGKAGDVASGS